MFINKIKLQNFRNFKEASFDFPDELIIIEGKNGIGKTNLLESIYLLCTGKSQRKSIRSEMIHFKSDFFFVEGVFISGNSEVSVGFGYNSEKKLSLLLNHQKQDSFFSWFGNRPIISFSSDDLILISGSPENRRKFLDFFGSYCDPDYLQLLVSYRMLIQRKNSLLRCKKFNSMQCDVYDEKLAVIGTELVLKRRIFVSLIDMFFEEVYCEIARNSDCVKIEYDSVLDAGNYSKDTCKNVFYNKLVHARKRDLAAGFSTFGPHREDLKIFINEKNARKFASQGQCRTLSIALKFSSSYSLEKRLQDHIILIIDDTVAELDSFRLDSFFSLVKNRGQVFLAAPVGRLSNNEEFYKVIIPEYAY